MYCVRYTHNYKTMEKVGIYYTCSAQNYANNYCGQKIEENLLKILVMDQIQILIKSMCDRKKLLQNFENIRLIMRFSCYFFHKEHHVYWQEMNSVTPKRAIIMFTARTILSDGRTGGGWKRKRRYMILLKN